MKILILFIALSMSLTCLSQIDSGKVKISLQIQARDCEYIAAAAFEKSNKFEPIDSVLKSKFRVASPPADNTNVTVDSIEVRVYRTIMQILRDDVKAVHKNVYKRLNDALTANGNVWIIDKINKDFKIIDDPYDIVRLLGRKYLRKEQNGD